MTRRQRSRFNKLAWAEQRALLELQWQQERGQRCPSCGKRFRSDWGNCPYCGSPLPSSTPSTSPSPPPSPLPNARGHAGAGVTRARGEESHRPTPDCQCSECRRYDELEGHA